MPKVPYPYEVNGKVVTGNGSLIPICSLSNRSLLPSSIILFFFLFSGAAETRKQTKMSLFVILVFWIDYVNSWLNSSGTFSNPRSV